MDEKQLSLFKLVKFKSKADTKMPANIKLEENQLWCPYCSNTVIFKRDKRLGVKKCPICSITLHDYWVKKVNNLV